MKKNILYLVLAILILSLSACNFGAPEPTPSPEVITIVVTATPEPATPTTPPTETPVEPTATSTIVPTATPIPNTPTPELLRFYVSGTVWHDKCTPMDGVTYTSPPEGCIDQSGGGYIANGIFEAGEEGIAGVTVRLEIDCSYGAFTTVTDANGYYSMSFTVPKDSGVVKQRICLSIDALSDGNNAVLIPGGWTYPAYGASVLYDVVIPVEETNTFNFGWDYQFK